MVEKTWKPSREGGNPNCNLYSPNVTAKPKRENVPVGEPYVCSHTGECCYLSGHPKQECLDCGLAQPKKVLGICHDCGGTIVLWTSGVMMFGGAPVMTEKCVQCGQEKNLSPSDEEWKAHGKEHLANEDKRFKEMKANLAKHRKG